MLDFNQRVSLVRQKIDAALCRSGRSGPVDIVAATKYVGVAEIRGLCQNGLCHMGENRVQDGLQKIETLRDQGIRWDLIGHLQTNKVKKAVQFFHCIQSIDSLRLLEMVNEEAERLGKRQEVLIQVNVSGESSKSGVSPVEFFRVLDDFFRFECIIVKGLMMMAPHEEDPHRLRDLFRETKKMYDRVQAEKGGLDTLSMGMSEDFELAVEEGSTMVRVGSILFKEELK